MVHNSGTLIAAQVVRHQYVPVMRPNNGRSFVYVLKCLAPCVGEWRHHHPLRRVVRQVDAFPYREPMTRYLTGSPWRLRTAFGVTWWFLL